MQLVSPEWQQRVPRVYGVSLGWQLGSPGCQGCPWGGSWGPQGVRDVPMSLSPQSEHFRTTSQKMARRYWWKNVKLLIILGLVGVIVLVLIILLATGTIPT